MEHGSENSHSAPQTVSPDLLKLLVCPVDKGALSTESEGLVCAVCGRRYPVTDGIPNMLPDIAE